MSVHAAVQPSSFHSVCIPSEYSGKFKYGGAEHNVTGLVEEIKLKSNSLFGDQPRTVAFELKEKISFADDSEGVLQPCYR